MSAYLARLLSGGAYRSIRNVAKDVLRHFPTSIEEAARRFEEYARGMATGGTLFEEMGFYYVGPIDGHNLDHLLPILKNVRAAKDGPVLLHVVTQKGKGYGPAEASDDKYHGVAKFNIVTGEQSKSVANAPSYTSVFAKSLIAAAEKDPRIIGITAAMPSGTGMDKFYDKFPDRCFDVGIAEQHAVTFAAGLASEGMRPFCALYSTFLQRAYDQVVHDVAIQKLPVRFIIDRAGLVGADGPTHAGAFDSAYLGVLPQMVLMAPSDEAELMRMVATQCEIDDRASAVRFPRGEGTGVDLPIFGETVAIGKGRLVRDGGRICLVSYGTRLAACLTAADALDAQGYRTSVVDARFMKPLDTDLLAQMARHHEVMVTVEEGSVGGFGSHVMQYLSDQSLLDGALKFRSFVLPDIFIDHDAPAKMYDVAGLNAEQIVARVAELMQADITPLSVRPAQN